MLVMASIVRDERGNFLGIVEEKDATLPQRQIKEVNMSTYIFDCACRGCHTDACPHRCAESVAKAPEQPARRTA